MQDSTLDILGAHGFAASAVAYLVLLVLLISRSWGKGPGRALIAAISVEIIWGIVLALPAVTAQLPAWLAAWIEAARNLTWMVFLLCLILASYASPAAPLRSDLRRRFFRYASGIALLSVASATTDMLEGVEVSFTLHAVLAVTALVWVEQVWRNTATRVRHAMKFLCLAILAKFSFDVVMYSDALLFARVDSNWWAARGYANALLVPLIAVSVARNPSWKLDLNVSRQVVFHSVTMLACGVFMLSVAIGGYYLQMFGGSWGNVAATMLAFVGTVVALLLLASETARAHVRVFISKHFFSYRYDYREEWLKFTRVLGPIIHGPGNSADVLASGVIAALADLVECRRGALWIRQPGGTFRCEGRAGHVEDFLPDLPAGDPLLRFLEKSDWIIDLAGEPPVLPAKEAPILPEWLKADSAAGILVPLLLDRDLIGVALLQMPKAELPLDWEVRDLLKTAARQAASYLALQLTLEELLQARQFDAFNRMSAFVVHDLKNLVAQLSLLLRNSDRHGGNPEFQRDMLQTLHDVHARMNGLLLQLHSAHNPIDGPANLSISKVIESAAGLVRDEALRPTVSIDPALGDAEVAAHKGRLERVLGHLLQNASDAAMPTGNVAIRASRCARQVLIEVSDDGIGMSEGFVKEQLFRPFSTTKKEGMGIGAFESKAYVQEIGGSLEVASAPGKGTTFSVRLPLRGLGG